MLSKELIEIDGELDDRVLIIFLIIQKFLMEICRCLKDIIKIKRKILMDSKR